MKKEQWKIAEVLYELGMSYDVIEKITSIAPEEVEDEMKRQQKEPEVREGTTGRQDQI